MKTEQYIKGSGRLIHYSVWSPTDHLLVILHGSTSKSAHHPLINLDYIVAYNMQRSSMQKKHKLNLFMTVSTFRKFYSTHIMCTLCNLELETFVTGVGNENYDQGP